MTACCRVRSHSPDPSAMGALRIHGTAVASTATMPVASLTLTFVTPGTARTAPLLGQHTDEILTEHGYDATAIAALRADGVVA